MKIITLVTSWRRGGEADSEWFGEGWSRFWELPTATSCDSGVTIHLWDWSCVAKTVGRCSIHHTVRLCGDYGAAGVTNHCQSGRTPNCTGFCSRTRSPPQTGILIAFHWKYASTFYWDVSLECGIISFRIVGLLGAQGTDCRVLGCNSKVG